MQNNDFYTEPASEENGQQEEVDLGTFKSVKTLKEAYDCLRKAFTQNAMKLAEYKKNESKSEESEISDATENSSRIDENSEKTIKNDEKTANFTQNSETLENLGIKETAIESDKVEATPDLNMEKVDKDFSPTLTRFEGEDWQKKIQDFFAENEDARQYAKEIGCIIMQNENVRNSADPLDKAWIKVLKNNSTTAIDDTKLEQYVLQNDALKQKVIEQYLKELQHKKSAPKVISERGGTQMNATKTPHALSMAEAKELAKKIMIK